jgi:lipoprotein-anchoring transpeptidase ErfK/SrfK
MGACRPCFGAGVGVFSLGETMTQFASRSALFALAACVLAGLAAPTPAAARDVVAFRDPNYSAGTIVIRTSERRLYYVLGNGRALRYPVGVGKSGKRWSGRTMISGKYLRPDWAPPASVKHDIPRLPNLIRGGTRSNPMGVAAMTLMGTEYAIHGTNRPGSVGGFVSYGCIRMYNSDIMDLYRRVSVGTTVVVTQ